MAYPELAFWELGNHPPRFMLSQRVLKTDTLASAKDKENALASYAGRNLREVELMIANTTNRIFLFKQHETIGVHTKNLVRSLKRFIYNRDD